MGEHTCRACRGQDGQLVLDLGEQPACDYFPGSDDPGPDPVYPLQMWLCAACGLAQLVADPTVPEEPRGAEPAALTAQAADAVARAAAAGVLTPGARVAEYGSPHGGSWLGQLLQRGLTPVAPDARADVVLDCFGLMHAADQAAALAERVSRLAPGGVLLLQYHSLDAIIRGGQWNALRHGHYAYYSAAALSALLAAQGLSARRAWQFSLYGGTVLLAAGRDGDASLAPDESVPELLAQEAAAGVLDPAALGGLQRDARAKAQGLHDWLVAERSAGHVVLGYGAASRAVSLLRWARADRSLVRAVADASPAKQGLRMPGTDIPVVSPAELAEARPAAVALFLADLLPEVRAALPEVEAAGGRWVNVEQLSAAPA
ncbi:MAG TPA: methyltransferase C-terminal domain-containing protein [Streptosporangiaceae bacterium]|nr:methyltransferase C-terminal domain-containing protein [Streptosporangiaceae bacterium]